MPFNCTVIEIKINLSRVKILVDKAFTILNNEIPEVGDNCEYCKWGKITLD